MMDNRHALYRAVWRWHFYAGVMVLPLVMLLAVTGTIYLFKPELDRFEERAFRGLDSAAAVMPEVQVAAALDRHPGARFDAYRLPEAAGDAALIRVGLVESGAKRDVYVSPAGRVVASVDPDTRISATVARLHGALLIGKAGSIIVEMAASWAIVMIVSGLFLWWPQGRGPAGVLWPRLSLGGRAFWRDLHAVTGFWVSGLVLVLLLTGLPWTDVWGPAFRAVRAEMGWVNTAPAGWRVGHVPDTVHDHRLLRQKIADAGFSGLDPIVEKARSEKLENPVLIMSPGTPNGRVWKVTSETQNRPLVRSISYDPSSGEKVDHNDFADKHIIDRVIGIGIAWHEGQLFGWINQLIGVLTAAMLFTLCVSGFVMWRRRAPNGLGAPTLAAPPPRSAAATAMLFIMALLLPLLGASLVALLLFDRLVLPRLPHLARWLGCEPAAIRRA